MTTTAWAARSSSLHRVQEPLGQLKGDMHFA